MHGLTPQELRLYRKLNTPIKIQNFLDSIPMNHEKMGETHHSPRVALQLKKAHCIEGALIGATALWLNGEKPLIMDLMAAQGDDDHVITLYKRHGHWGALSKTNHATIRYRDPVYKTLRELALSYFHEWFLNSTGKKTLRSYSDALDMSTFGDSWVTSEKGLWWLDRELNKKKHHLIAPIKNIRLLRTADAMELKAGRLIEWPESNKRT